MEERFKHLNNYLKEKFGERTLKICIDGDFTCPNRDGKLGFGGCIFCSERGSGDHIKLSNNITEQVINYFNSYKSKRANKFIAYFQNYTNTYSSIDILKSKYDSALIDNRIVALAVSTRPDCINEDVCKLLKSYTDRYYVWVELGLQTSNDKTSKLINKCCYSKDFTNAVNLLNKYNIDIVTHIMVGLPNENFNDIKNTVEFINKHFIQGLKIHSTYIVKNTILADMYSKGLYIPLTLEEYLNYTCYILTHISPNIVIHKVSGDAPKDLLVAPEWNLHKKWILNGLDKKMSEEDLWQGKFWEQKNNYN